MMDLKRLAMLGAAAWLLAGGVAVAQDLDLDLDAEIEVGDDDERSADVEADADLDVTPPPTGSATERARAEFAAGLACVEEHETACAEAHFRAALALRDAPAIRYNLASALYDLGRFPEAARLTASVLADGDTPPEVMEPAQLLQTQLAEEGGTLSITLAGSTDGAEVAVDGEAVPASQLEAVIVSPGPRRVVVTRRGATAAEREVAVAAGARVPIEIEVAPTAEEVAVQAAEAPAPTERGGDDLAADWRFWAVVGGAVLVVATIVLVAVVAADNATPEDPIVGNYDPGVLRWD